MSSLPKWLKVYIDACHQVGAWCVATIGALTLFLLVLALLDYSIESFLKSFNLYQVFIKFVSHYYKNRGGSR